jgi:superfamily II DNA or RNA helicase
MSSNELEKKRRCENGTRWNNKTKKCEPKKSKKYTFKRGEGRGQVEQKRKAEVTEPSIIPPLSQSNLPEIVSDLHPLDVDENTPNPLLQSVLESSNKPNELTDFHPLDIGTKTRSPLVQKIIDSLTNNEPVRTGKKIILNKSVQPTPTQVMTPIAKEDAYSKYDKMKLDELRNIWAGLMGLEVPRKTKYTGKFTTKELLINEIIRLENEKEKEEEEEDETNEIIIPPKDSVVERIEESEKFPEEPFIIDQPAEENVEPSLLEDSNVVEKETEPSVIPEPFIEEIEEEEEQPEPETQDEKQLNKLILQKELQEYENAKTNNDYDYLYPTLNDPNFNIKIAKRKEFNDTKYDGTIYDIRKQTELLCNADFELMPHQLFIKNFLSFQTPYNSLLLYHMLGSGKTCSAIGVAEEMRSYMKQVGIRHKIIVVASPNVQANFRMQLFDERKLKEENGLWNLNTCIGSALIKEINPTNLKGVSRERVISQIRGIINTFYIFMGYIELANYITKKTVVSDESGFSDVERKSMEIKKIKKFFNNRLIIIDEVHNIRMTDDNKNKRTATLLMKVARYSENMRLLLLSATPMYNSYKEIIWLVKLMNINDKRASIDENDVFDKEGNFKEIKEPEAQEGKTEEEGGKAEGGKAEGGRELLQRKLIGYISYVRGENPYTFPYRIYPSTFSPENTITPEKYPTIQMNKKPIEEPIKNIPVYTSIIGEYQQKGYEFILENMRKKSFNKSNTYGDETIMPSFENMERFGYNILQIPLEALNIVYPSSRLDELVSQTKIEDLPFNQELNNEIITNIVGKSGLSNIMTYTSVTSPQPLRYDFEYKPNVLEKYGKIFSREHIGKYSNKIAKICDCVMNSNGIVLVYSQYIDGGVVPIALALEELGFARYCSDSNGKSLLKTPNEPLDALTMKPKSQVTENFKQARYVMITGDAAFSPNNTADIKYITNSDNKNGELVKVVLISKAAAEGLDFKNIRQVHILEPWYNMNRIEQIIGRGVRNLSHCMLPFEERNVEIYLHSTLPSNGEEPADLYVYRLAEKKAIQIGRVTRLLKEVATDCILNIGQTNFTVDKLLELAENQNIQINLSSKKTIEYKIGDKPFTDICDYMDNCSFTCSPTATISESDIVKDTYNDDYVKMNYSIILKRIRQLFREQPFYKKDMLINLINVLKEYPKEQIYYTLTQLIDNKNEYLFDQYGRRGYLINKDDYYIFQPIEITNEKASIYERSVPVDYKRESLSLELPKQIDTMSMKEKENVPEQPIIDNHKIEPEIPILRTYEEVFDDIKKSLDIALNSNEIETGDTNWYKHTSFVLDILKDAHEMPMEFIVKYIFYHYLDCCSIEDKLVLIQHIYKSDYEIQEDSEYIIKKYFDEKIGEARNTRFIVLTDKTLVKIYIWKENQWIESRQVDREKVNDAVQAKYLIARDNINKFVGFIHLFKNNEMHFKTKDISQQRNNKGALCSNAGKSDIVKRLNSVLEENDYQDEKIEGILKIGLCVIMEMTLRYFTETNFKGRNKVYFMDGETALINKITEI